MTSRFVATQTSQTEAIDTLADELHNQVGAAKSNAAASPYQLTAADVLSGMVINTTNGAIQFNLPTPASLVAAMANAQVGSGFFCLLRQDGDNTLTISTNSVTGITLNGTATIATTLGQVLCFKLTNVTSGSEAYTCFVGLKVAN